MKEKIAGPIQGVILIIAIFSFSYFINLATDSLPLVSASDGTETFSHWIDNATGATVTYSTEWTKYPISTAASGTGCCFVTKDKQVCATSDPENCLPDSPFVEGALCSNVDFCKPGCCYNEDLGIYENNVLKSLCQYDWIDDPNCNLPGARMGCCVLGDETVYETSGQCKTDSLVRAIGGTNTVNWNDNIDEATCSLLSLNQGEGACLIGNSCEFLTRDDCLSDKGNFAEGYLCTSPSLNTSCKMTKNTKCFEGRDEVFFVDSCGNRANVYDSSRVDDPDYWDKVIEYNDLCGVNSGNGNSKSCGNCDRFLGGICSSASDDNFDVNIGNYYCKDTSCEFDGETYTNGESWCVYDGAIGNGSDVVGSRHWKYVCSQGEVQVEPCADYRNEICIMENEMESPDGSKIDFHNANCVPNNYRECFGLNSEDGIDKCKDAVNCRIETVAVADHFNFDVCVPKYPAGFDLSNSRYDATAKSICGMATQKCEVVNAPKMWGGCKYVANKGCLTKAFAEQMNDFCRSLGDCGGSVNILGEWNDNYRVRRTVDLNDDYVNNIIATAKPVRGQFAKAENYSKYLEAAGLSLSSLKSPGEEGANTNLPSGVGGVGMASFAAVTGGAASIATWTKLNNGLLTTTADGAGAGTTAGAGAGNTAVSGFNAGLVPVLKAFGAAAMAFQIGYIAGGMLASHFGLSPGGSLLMAVGVGFLVLAFAIWAHLSTLFSVFGPIGWIASLIIGAILVIASLFFGGDNCDNVVVEFECKPWQAPSGGSNCDKCNGDPMKPCSEYRCESLGAACEFINKGTGDELCVNGNPNDIIPPQISYSSNFSFDGGSYKATSGGYEIAGKDGGCLDAYKLVPLQILTDEPAQCKFDMSPLTKFEDMEFDLGGNSYIYNHTAYFPLPDPSHGESQGWNWTGKLDFYIKCMDRNGFVSLSNYDVSMCVREGDDRTPPVILATEPLTDNIMSFDATEFNLSITTNELSTCKWDLDDGNYVEMANSFKCDERMDSPSTPFGYACNDELPVVNGSETYYIRCEDQPWLNNSEERNANTESFKFKIKRPVSKISIDKIKPDGHIEIGSDSATVELKVGTSGGGDYHNCKYSFSGYDNMINFFETGKDKVHTQILNLAPGSYTAYIECSDETGDFVRNTTSFEIERDSSAPQVARVWQDGGFLNLVLLEDGECKYSFDGCKFVWDDGVEIGTGNELRFAVVRGEKYYIKCADGFGNTPNGCSVEVVAT